MTKEDIKKKYPDYKEDNIDFYLKILQQHMQMNLGILSKKELSWLRNLDEIDRAKSVQLNIKGQLDKILELSQQREDPLRDLNLDQTQE